MVDFGTDYRCDTLDGERNESSVTKPRISNSYSRESPTNVTGHDLSLHERVTDTAVSLAKHPNHRQSGALSCITDYQLTRFSLAHRIKTGWAILSDRSRIDGQWRRLSGSFSMSRLERRLIRDELRGISVRLVVRNRPRYGSLLWQRDPTSKRSLTCIFCSFWTYFLFRLASQINDIPVSFQGRGSFRRLLNVCSILWTIVSKITPLDKLKILARRVKQKSSSGIFDGVGQITWIDFQRNQRRCGQFPFVTRHHSHEIYNSSISI